MKRVIAGIALAGLLAAGCGNDEAQADVRRFCELVEQYNKGNGFVAPPEDTPADQQEAALTQALRDYLALPEIQAILDELAQVAPPEVDAQVDTMRATANELVASGENRFDQPEPVAANDAIKAYTETACAPDDEAAPADGDAADGDAAATEG